MNRFVQRKNDYENALKRLKEALVDERLFGIFGFRK